MERGVIFHKEFEVGGGDSRDVKLRDKDTRVLHSVFILKAS